MAPDIQRNPDDSITVSFTFKPAGSMLESELNLQAMSNLANALAAGECLKGFDTDGSPIVCSAPRFAVEIIAVWAVASSLYTVGIVTLCRVILC